MKTELLEEIGLTRSEIKVYLALLELGSTTTGKIVDKSKASSSKIYEILEKLIQKGLVSFVIKSGTKHFEAADPKRLLDYMKEKEKKLRDQEKELMELLPKLQLKRTLSKHKSEATIYKGMKGLETAFQDILKTLEKGDANRVFVVGGLDEKMNDFFKRHYQLRSKKGIKTKTIFSESGRNHYNSRKHIPFFEGKVIGTTTSPATINVYGDKVNFRMGDSSDVICVVIHNKKLAQSFVEQFDAMWNQDVTVYTGFDNAADRFDVMLDSLNRGEEYYVLGLSMTGSEEGYKAKWFYDFHKRRVEKGVKALLLCDPEYISEMKKRTDLAGDENRRLTQLKALSPEFSSPIQINLYGRDTVGIFTWDKEFRCFEVKSKSLFDNFKKYFDALWNQDTVIEQGFEAFERAWTSLFDEIKPGGSYEAFGASFGTKEDRPKYMKFFEKLHKERIKRGIKSRLLFEPGTSEYIHKYGLTDLYNKDLEYKTLPFETDSPVEVFTYNDKTLLLIQKEEPTIITIKNKEVSQSFKKYFESFWNQDTVIVKGFDAMSNALNNFVDGIDKKDTFNALGATFGLKGNKQEYADVFKKYHDYRIEKGIKARLLFQPSARKTYLKNKKNYGKCDVRFLPYDTDSPVSIHPYKDKTMMIIQDKIPTTITIKNKEITQSFLKHFENLWNQETRIVKGLDAVQELFEEMLEVGQCDLIGARGYFVDRRPKFIDDWEKRAKKRGFTMRNIVDPGSKGHRITQFPYAKTKYTLSREFSELSVFWIFGNKVAISNWVKKEPIVTVIENKNFYNLYKKQFELMWKKKII